MSDVSRRQVIGAGAAVAAAGAVAVGAPLVGAPAAQAAGYTSADALYRRPRFAALRGKGFSLVRNGVGTPVTLREVADLDSAPAGAERQFRLTFTCRGAVPAQGTYSLRRSGFTATSLFVVPDPATKGVTVVVNSAQ